MTLGPVLPYRRTMPQKPATEIRTEKELRRRGALLVVRSAGSRGPADYVAVFSVGTLFIQVVGPNDRPTREDAERLLVLKGPNRYPQIWHWRYMPGTSRLTRKRRRYAGVMIRCIDNQKDVDGFKPARK